MSSAKLVPAALLPPGVKDDRQEAFLTILDGDLSVIDLDSFVMTDAYTVDARLLPHLVREFSLEEFITPGLPEAAIRNFIANAYELHALKGYIEGVRLGLSMLDVRLHWRQWWQQEPKGAHNTHRVSVFIDDVLFDDSILGDKRHADAITRIVNATKRESQFIDLGFGVNPVATGYVGAAMRHRHKIRILAEQPLPVFDGAPLGTGTGIHIRSKIHTTVVAASGLSDGALMTQQGQALRTHNGVHIVTGNDA